MLDAARDEPAPYIQEPDALKIDKANRPMEISAHTSMER